MGKTLTEEAEEVPDILPESFFDFKTLVSFFTTKEGLSLFTKLKTRIDTDGDGKISSNEFVAFLRSDVVKFTIISIFAMVFEEFVNWVIHLFTTGEFAYSPFSDILKSFGGYLILMVWFKSWMDTNNKDKIKLKNELDVSNGIILSHAAEINKLNDKHERALENQRNNLQTEITLRDAQIQTLKLENSWLQKGFDPQKIQDYMILEQSKREIIDQSKREISDQSKREIIIQKEIADDQPESTPEPAP